MSTPADLEPHGSEWTEQRQTSTRTVGDEVADQLRDLIHRGDLSPGDRLPSERKLCETLGVGRLAVREALASLRAQGYVTVRRGQQGGSYVTTLAVPYRDWWMKMRQNPGLLQEIMEFRMAVEISVAQLAAARRDDADILAMRQAVDASRDCVDAGRFRQADSMFHAALARASKNERLYRSMLSCRSELFVPANTEMVTAKGMSDTYHQHLAVLTAITRSDSEGAGEAMRDHLMHAVHDIQGSLDSFDPAG